MSSQPFPRPPAPGPKPAAPLRRARWRSRPLAVACGLNVAAFEAGRSDAAAPVLVLVHGLGHFTQAAWSVLAAEFEATHRVIAFDLPGCGASGRPEAAYDLDFFHGVLREVVADVRGPFALGGHSFGGLIAADYAARRQDDIRALALIAPAGFLRTPVLVMRAIASVAALASRAQLAPNPGFVRRTLVKSVFDPAAIPADDCERAVALACEPAAARAFLGVYAGALHEIVHARALGARLASWRGPTTLTWGREDGFIPVRALAAAKEVYPQAVALELERCGHCPAIEHPAAVAAHLRANGV